MSNMKINREQELMCALSKIDHEGCKALLQSLTKTWDDCINDLESMQIRGQISSIIQYQEQSDITLKAIEYAAKCHNVRKIDGKWYVYIATCELNDFNQVVDSCVKDVALMDWYKKISE